MCFSSVWHVAWTLEGMLIHTLVMYSPQSLGRVDFLQMQAPPLAWATSNKDTFQLDEKWDRKRHYPGIVFLGNFVAIARRSVEGQNVARLY